MVGVDVLYTYSRFFCLAFYLFWSVSYSVGAFDIATCKSRNRIMYCRRETACAIDSATQISAIVPRGVPHVTIRGNAVGESRRLRPLRPVAASRDFSAVLQSQARMPAIYANASFRRLISLVQSVFSSFVQYAATAWEQA